MYPAKKIKSATGLIKRPKILLILHLPPPVHGAAMVGQYIHESSLVKAAFDCDYIDLQTARQISDIGKGFLRKFFSFLRIYSQVLVALFSKRYDLCYISINAKGPAFYKEIIIVFLVKLFGCKPIYHYHNKGIVEVQDKWLPNALYRYQFKNSRVIHLSPLLYPDIEKYVPKEEVYFLANGIPDLAANDFASIQSKRMAKQVPEILYLSNMMKVKGVYVLLEACKILHRRGIAFKTNFIGATSDISESDFNAFVAENDLQEKVFYVGKKYGAEKAAYYERADVFAFPPIGHDLFPLVTLEAMQYGIPIISTEEGAIPEIVGDGIQGYIIPKKDPEALADKIEYLLDNPDLRNQMGRNGRKKYEAQYTIKKFEKSFVNTLHQAIRDLSA